MGSLKTGFGGSKPAPSSIDGCRSPLRCHSACSRVSQLIVAVKHEPALALGGNLRVTMAARRLGMRRRLLRIGLLPFGRRRRGRRGGTVASWASCGLGFTECEPRD